MALTATATQGFELYRRTAEDEILWVPGDPGVTYTEGMSVSHSKAAGSGGLVIVDAGNSTQVVGTVAKSVVCPANTQAFPASNGGIIDQDTAAAKCLVKVRSRAAAGTPVYKVTFANHWDDTVTSWTAGTLTLVVGTGMSVNDYANGSLVYIYEGPGAGQVNVVDDYVHGSLALVMHRKFDVAPTSASKVIVIGGEAVAHYGVSFFCSCQSASGAITVTVNDGANNGNYVVYASWHEIGPFLKNLTLPVIPRQSYYIADLA